MELPFPTCSVFARPTIQQQFKTSGQSQPANRRTVIRETPADDKLYVRIRIKDTTEDVLVLFDPDSRSVPHKVKNRDGRRNRQPSQPEHQHQRQRKSNTQRQHPASQTASKAVCCNKRGVTLATTWQRKQKKKESKPDRYYPPPPPPHPPQHLFRLTGVGKSGHEVVVPMGKMVRIPRVYMGLGPKTKHSQHFVQP